MERIIKTKKKNYVYFIGIDVSKHELDYAVLKNSEFLLHKEGENKPQAIVEFVQQLKEIPGFSLNKAIFCMEETGFYCNHLLNTLQSCKANIVVENALRIKNSMGLIRGKQDREDAIRIAQFAQKNAGELRFWEPRRPVITKLAHLVTLRNRLISTSVILKNALQEQQTFVKDELNTQSTDFCSCSIEAIQNDLAAINEEIKHILFADQHLNRLNELITSVIGIGIVASTQIIISTNEFKDIKNPKKFACYAGVAPFRKESGLSSRRPKVSHIANKKVKALLHICAVVAVRWDDGLRDYYKRKTVIEGKPKMAVMNAVRNKLILRVFACVNQNRCYEKNYIRLNSAVEDTPDKTDLPVNASV